MANFWSFLNFSECKVLRDIWILFLKIVISKGCLGNISQNLIWDSRYIPTLKFGKSTSINVFRVTFTLMEPFSKGLFTFRCPESARTRQTLQITLMHIVCTKRKNFTTYQSRGSQHTQMLLFPQNVWVENTWFRCWVHKICRQGCSLGFDKLVACYKRCNKTPNDQQEMICKRDREERNRIQTGYCCMILRSMWRQETISKKKWCIRLP